SLVMAKVVILSDLLAITHAFSKKPLIYNTVWKSFIYVTMSFVVRFLERFVPLAFEEKSLGLAFSKVLADYSKVIFWASEAWLCILFIIFVAGRELVTAIGKEKIKKLFFG